MACTILKVLLVIELSYQREKRNLLLPSYFKSCFNLSLIYLFEKLIYAQTGMNTQDYKYKWGGEDWDLIDRVLMMPLEVERIKHPGLYHHCHSRKGMWN